MDPVVTRRTAILKTVAEFMSNQREPARSLDDECRYRVGGTDLKCAVGALIPDEHYTPKMEGVSMQALLSRERSDNHSNRTAVLKRALDASGIHQDDWEFLKYIQEAHDLADTENFMLQWRRGLLSVAAHFGLDSDVIPE